MDTCAVIDLLTDPENLGSGAIDLVRDPNNMLCASFETMRELVVHFLSSDTRFWFYRDQGLDLIEY